MWRNAAGDGGSAGVSGAAKGVLGLGWAIRAGSSGRWSVSLTACIGPGTPCLGIHRGSAVPSFGQCAAKRCAHECWSLSAKRACPRASGPSPLLSHARRAGMTVVKFREARGELFDVLQHFWHILFYPRVNRSIIRSFALFLESECNLTYGDASGFGALAIESPQLAVG